MEKNTKILIGVGAVIAAYLILKPKKAVTSGVAVVPSEEKPQPKVTGGYPCPDGTIDYDYTDNGVMSPCVGHKSSSERFVLGSSNMGLRLQEIERELKLVQIPQVI